MKFKVFLISTSSVLTGLICLFLILGNSTKPHTNTSTQHEGLVVSTQGEVLQATDSNRPEGNIVFNVPSIFNQVTTFRDDIEAPGQNINLGEGEITASNVIYSLTPGEGITITGGQNATISATAGITSVQNEIGDITFTAADGLSIDGLAFTNTDRGSSQNIFKTFRVNGQSDITAGSNSDTFEFIAGSGINLSTDASAKKLTITSASATQVWQESGSNVSLVTSSNNVGIGTSSPTEKLQVIGNTDISGNLIVGGSATINGNTYTNFAGNGLALNSGTVNINLTTSGNTGATSSNSGLEVSASGISLLKGCANNELLKWNDGSSAWECAADAGGTSGIINIEEGDSLVSNTAGTLDLNASDFTVTESPAGEVNIGIDYANSEITRNNQDESIVGNWSYLNNVVIDGSADEIQLLVQGNTSQTANILTIENSSGTDLFTIDPSGNADIAGALNVGTSNAFQINSSGEITSAAGLSSSGNLTFTGSGTYTFANIASGAAFSNNRIVSTNSAGQLSTVPDGSNNQVLTTNGSGVLSWTSIGTILEPTNAFLLNGNSFTANATLGTNDNFPLIFETNGLPRTTITSTGNFGIGDTTPASLFTVGSGDLFQVDSSGSITAVVNITASGTVTSSGTVDINGNLAIADAVILLDAASAQTVLATGGDLQLGADNDSTNLLTLSSDGTNLTLGTTDGANLTIDTAGSLTVADAATFNGRVVISHGNNQGLRLPTNAGAPSGVTGTSEGDIVYDSTNDALYIYDGAAFQQIGGGAYAGWTISDGVTSQSISSGNTLTVNDSTTVNATVSATDTLTLNVIADSLDFTELSDSLSLDAATTISLGANALTFNANGAANAIINLSSTGDFVIQDNGAGFATFTDSGVFQIDSLNLDGTTIGLTTDTNLLSLADNALTVNGSITTGAASITGGIDNNSGGLTETGSIAGATDITASGTITSSGTVDINGNLAIADAVILLDAASAQTVLATGGDLQLGADNDSTNLLTLSSDGTNLTLGTTDGANLTIDTAGSLTVADAATFNAGLTLAAGQNITINSESFNDLTGIGLQRNIDGSLETTLGTSITGSEITDNTIEEVDLEVTNSGTDGYILSFDSATGGFTWISNTGGSGASKWSTGSTVTYLTNTSADLTFGAGDTATAPFFFDVSANLLRIGDGANDANDPSIVFYASDTTNSGTLSFDDNDDFVFTGGDVNFTGGILGAGLSDCDASSSKLLWDNSTNQFSCGTDAGSGGGSSKWTEAGNLTYLTTTGNAVTIGSSTELAKLAIDGDTAGEISFLIQTAASQTANALVIENNTGTDSFVIDSTGNVDVGTWTASVISAAYGGTGDDTSGTTGVPYIASGNWQYESALALSRGGTGASLADPNADRILFWDDSAGASEWLSLGSGLTISGTTIDHADTSSQASSDNSGTTVIQDIVLDGYGHITGLSTVDLSSSFDNYQSWTVDGDDADTRTISSTETLIFTGGTGIDTDVNAAADEITFNLDLTEINGNQTFGDGTSNATATWTIGLSGATDPTVGFANNAITLTAGSVAVVGNLDVSGTFTSGTADAFQINSSGAITSGTWNGTVISAAYGGTGISSYTAGDLLYASAGTTISKLAVGSPGEVLTVSGGNLPSWATPGVAFNNITSGTNTTAAMIVGTGSSLNYQDSGTINASSLQGATWAVPGAIGATTPNSGAFTSLSSTGITTLASGAGVATTIGNATGTFQLISNTIDISTGGDISGATGFSSSGNLNFTGTGTYRLANIASAATFSGNRIVVTDQDGDLATIADGNNGEVLTTNGSGSLTWSTAAGLIAADSLDFDDFADAMTLDASTSITQSGSNALSFVNSGTANMIFNLSSTGDLVIQDNGAARFTFNDSGNLDVTSTAYIGLGASAGRIIFSDLATDEIDLQDANLDMNNNLIINIGNSGTDFDSSGGLTLAGDLNVNSGNILSSATANLLNATSTTINFAGAATLLNIGDSTTTKTIDIGGVTNSGTDTINIATNGTAADTITIGNSNASTTMILTGGDDWSISSAGTFTGENLVLSSGTTTTAAFTRSSAGQWISFSDGVDVWGLYNTAGSPEGVLTANTGALSMDTTNGTLYVKTDDGDNTGWVNLATGSSSPFTDGGTITYLTDTAEDFAVGATNSLTAPFSVDVSTNTVRVGSGTATNGTINIYNANNANASITYNTDSELELTGTTIELIGDVVTSAGIIAGGSVYATDFVCTDCLDFTELSDNLALDASTTITQDGSEVLEFVNNGTGNTIIDLQSTGDFVIQDNNTDFFTISDTRVITYDYNGTTTTAFNFNANSLTTGNGLDISANGLTSGNAFEIASTSTVLTSGRLANIDWSPGSATTATGDLLRINIGANGNVGNLFNITDNGSTLFSVSESSISANLPTSFNAAGDVSIANDLVMTNQTASYIKSNGPLTIEAGESFENNNLTLKTYGTGDIALDFASSGDLIVGASNSAGTNIGGNGILAYGAICADDTVDNADDCIDAARTAGTVYGIASSFTIDDIAENFPTADGSIEGADIVAFEYKAPGNNLNDPFEYAYETEFVAKGTPTNATNILGVVSAKPGITLGGWGQRKDPRSAQEVAVALSGRVPVKITSENGNINPGDLITVSQTKPGAGMRSTNPSDTIIGKALDKYTSTDVNQIGTVLIFVNTQWSRESASLAGATTVASNPNGTSGSQAILADAIIYNTVLGTLTFKEDATFQGTATFEQLTQFFGKTEFNGEVSFTEAPSFPNQMAGYTSIKTGETKVTIKFSKPFKIEPVITVSPLDNSIPYTVTQRNESGFTIELNSPAAQPTMFSWIALPVN